MDLSSPVGVYGLHRLGLSGAGSWAERDNHNLVYRIEVDKGRTSPPSNSQHAS